MDITPQTTEIDGFVVTSTELPAMDGLELGAEIAAALGPAYGKILEMFIGDPDDDVDFAALSKTIFDNLTPSAIASIAPKLLRGTAIVVNNKRLSLLSRQEINFAFTGRKFTMMKVLIWVGEVNFKDFFDKATAVIKARLAAVAALVEQLKSKSDQTSVLDG